MERAVDKRNPFRLRLWRRVRNSFAAWHDHANSRIELTDLADSTLQDIGLTRGHERFGGAKLFWIP
jgi:uncharacterized protein YjiS (DUF1127 family)